MKSNDGRLTQQIHVSGQSQTRTISEWTELFQGESSKIWLKFYPNLLPPSCALPWLLLSVVPWVCILLAGSALLREWAALRHKCGLFFPEPLLSSSLIHEWFSETDVIVNCVISSAWPFWNTAFSDYSHTISLLKKALVILVKFPNLKMVIMFPSLYTFTCRPKNTVLQVSMIPLVSCLRSWLTLEALQLQEYEAREFPWRQDEVHLAFLCPVPGPVPCT